MAVGVKGTPNSAAAASVTIPTHAVGDLIVLFVYRDGANTAIAVPSAGGTVPTWTVIDNNGGANANVSCTVYCVATATNHTSGTWSFNTGMVAAVLDGQAASPIGGHAEAGSAASNSATAPSVTMTRTDGTSVLLEFYGHKTVTAWSAAPAGYTRQTSVASEVCCNTKDFTTTDGSIAQPCTTSSNVGYRGATVEILSAAGTDYTPSATDAVGITDAVTKDVGRSRTDAVGLTDSTAVEAGRTTTDPVTAGDAMALQQGRTTTDPVGVTDTVTVTQDFATAVDDPVQISDSADVVADYARTHTDPVDVTDGVLLEQSRDVTDPVDVTDLADVVVDAVRAADDTVAVSDSATFDLVGAGDVGHTDVVGVSDHFTVDVSVEFTDPIGVTDSVFTGYERSWTDPVGVTDAAEFVLDGNHDIDGTDPVAVGDQLLVAVEQAWTDPVGVTDAAVFQLGDLTAHDTLTLTDTAVVELFGPADVLHTHAVHAASRTATVAAVSHTHGVAKATREHPTKPASHTTTTTPVSRQWPVQ